MYLYLSFVVGKGGCEARSFGFAASDMITSFEDCVLLWQYILYLPIQK